MSETTRLKFHPKLSLNISDINNNNSRSRLYFMHYLVSGKVNSNNIILPTCEKAKFQKEEY